MKRRIDNMSMFQGVTFTPTNDVVDPEIVIVNTEVDEILKEIFSVDPRSGLPKGDLAYYLSKDGNPQVKSWLENNLLQPRAVANNSNVKDLTDDMIAEYAKQPDESADAYAVRIKGIFDEASANYQQAQLALQRKKEIEVESKTE